MFRDVTNANVIFYLGVAKETNNMKIMHEIYRIYIILLVSIVSFILCSLENKMRRILYKTGHNVGINTLK